MTASYLPENTDQDDPKNQAIYDSLSRLTGVDGPALVFRTIGTFPGALTWCWENIGYLFEQGLIQRSGWRIGSDLSLPQGLKISQEMLDLLGIDECAKQKVEKALNVYNRVNPCNLMAICVLNRVLKLGASNEPTAVKQLAIESWTPPAPILPITTMIAPQSMPDALLRLIEQISLDQPSSDQPQLVPSLYRHLANVPSFLVLASALLRPLLMQGQLTLLTTHIREQAVQESLRLTNSIITIPSKPLADQARIHTLFQRFSWKIPEMIVIGEILRRALP
jgi:hypothetical protein